MCSTFTMHPISIYINMYVCTCIGIKSLFTIWQDHSLISGRRIPCCQVPEVPPVEEAKVPRTERSEEEEEEKAAREVEEHGPRRYQICHDLIWFAYIICVLFLIVSCVSLNRYTYIFWSRYILSCILKVLCTKQTTYLYTLTIHCFQLYLSTYVLIVRKDMFYPSCCDPDWHCSETRLRQAYQVASVVGKCPVVIYSGFEIVKSFQWTHKNIMWVKQGHLHHPPEKITIKL